MLYVAIAVFGFCPAQLTCDLPIPNYWGTFCVSRIARVRTGRLVVDTRLRGICYGGVHFKFAAVLHRERPKQPVVLYALQVVNSGVNSMQTNVSF